MSEDEFQDPDWKAGGRVHNWRRYIDPELRAIWNTFTPIQRTLIGKSFDVIASNEDWD